MIQVQNLTKLYGTHLAVDDISFKVKKGHIYGFLGPNGAGKSTTMNMITGYIAPTIGTITINGHDLGKETLEAKKCIGYLPENPPLYQDMYVKEYLEFVAKLKKTDKTKRSAEIEEIMKKTGLNDVSGRLIKNLSKGYKQRVGIAQALLGNPEIVILDEPTVGLDPEQIIEIRTLIKSLKKNHTVILSSHILSEISAVCDDVLMIAKGKVVAMDTTENILKKNKSGQRITITVKGEASRAEEVLKKLKCLESYKLIAKDKGQASFELEVKETKKDVREEVSFALSDARILIIEMNMSKASLEDVYLDILQECREAEEAEMTEEEENVLTEAESDVDDENSIADAKETGTEGGEES
ncbi:MAG: ATP-binding cassette domain-containing protein [Lachnospiraceae bacterium]|nr:ATP-binding cassette domain-containing protein [Lachnospiraceae bacterium]